MNTRYFSIIIFLFILASCARRGRPEGGPKDFDKPIMVRSDPEFKSLHFEEDEIKIYFDEYIKLKDVNSQLIISPPLKYPAVISPLGTPSKRLTIKLSDTLQENTTYTFNFGQSIVDNTEGNILENFKYIISTGDYIDSLLVKGTIKDAFRLNMIENPTLMLYPVEEVYNDSIVYYEKPTYVGSTLDSVNWSITNIKEGVYRLIALNDASKNYKFNPREDRIGYSSELITIPGDSVVDIRLFKEILPFDIVSKPKDVTKGHVIIGFQGESDSVKIKVLSETPKDFKSFYGKDRVTDTLNFWFNNYDKDSLLVEVSRKGFVDTLKVNLNEDEIDSLKLGSSHNGLLHLRDTLKLTANVPVEKLDTAKISFMDGDSIKIPFNLQISPEREVISIHFEKEVQMRYKLTLYPGAIKDIFGVQNDTLNISLKTGKIADYSSIFLTLRNVERYPIIVDLINERGDIVAKKFAREPREFEFINLRPARFMVRIIYDDNGNGKWDTGNFLEKLQPEKVYYIKKIIETKPNWEVVETLSLDP